VNGAEIALWKWLGGSALTVAGVLGFSIAVLRAYRDKTAEITEKATQAWRERYEAEHKRAEALELEVMRQGITIATQADEIRRRRRYPHSE
jgi:hypothetical protein